MGVRFDQSRQDRLIGAIDHSTVLWNRYFFRAPNLYDRGIFNDHNPVRHSGIARTVEEKLAFNSGKHSGRAS
jgi:hypothetical protein